MGPPCLGPNFAAKYVTFALFGGFAFSNPAGSSESLMTLLTGDKVNLVTMPINWTYALAFNRACVCNFSGGLSALFPMQMHCLQKAFVQGVKTYPMHTGMSP